MVGLKNSPDASDIIPHCLQHGLYSGPLTWHHLGQLNTSMTLTSSRRDALSNAGYKYHRILSILWQTECQGSIIYARLRKVVRSNNACRRNQSRRLIYAGYFREGCYWLMPRQPYWWGTKIQQGENQPGFENRMYLQQQRRKGKRPGGCMCVYIAA